MSDSSRRKRFHEDILALDAFDVTIEELERRLESAPLQMGHLLRQGAPRVPGSGAGPCGCLGTLCMCDGHDCLEVCDVHCLVHYV